MKPPRIALLVLIAAMALVLAACQQGATGGGPQPIGPPVFGDGDQGRDVDGGPIAEAPGGGGFLDQPPDQGQADRSIIRTGEITVEVEDVPQTTGAVRALAVELGGFISQSFQGEFEDSATLTMRIPADRFEDALAAIHELDGEVKAEATNEEDVTAVVLSTIEAASH